VVAVARTALQMPRFNLLKQMSASKAVIGLNILTLWDQTGSAARWRGALQELLDDGTIRPVVSKAFPFIQAPDAHRFISERHNVGKVVLTPG
jgi:NADPH:quinone reductase-like Zn-dependent oxidoreductase